MAQGASGRIEQAHALSSAWRWSIVACSMAALLWVVMARVLGPSDLWDQTQPKTIAYTTDIIVHGRWLLPRERGEYPATKPPLYNWLAVPAVRLLGCASEVGHKLPSLAAMCLCWLAIVRLGRAVFGARGPGGELVGWLGGLAFTTNYAIFKLGYLARPDMLLTLWLLLGWIAVTWLLIRAGGDASLGPEGGRSKPAARQRWLTAAFWLCVGLAGLTKGPAILPLLVYAVIAARLIGGRWRAINALYWWWGLPASLAMIGLWVWGVWRVDPGHLWNKLWMAEIAGRVTGTGTEGADGGPLELLTGAPNMAVYYLLRFLPWSVLSILAMAALWRRDRAGGPRAWRGLGTAGAILHGAALFVVIVIALYTLSAGKRADYIAAAFGPGSILAAWWLVYGRPPLAIRAPALASAAAGLVLLALTLHNQWQPAAPCEDFAANIESFARQARQRLQAEPRPVAFWSTGPTHLQSLLGLNEPDGQDVTLELIDRGEPCWVVAGQKRQAPSTFEGWLPKHRDGLRVTAVLRSAMMPRAAGWREQVTLYLVEPAEAGTPPTE